MTEKSKDQIAIDKVISSAVTNITKKYGEGTAFILGKSDKATAARCTSIGVLSVDRAVYGPEGAVPRGMIMEVTGWESTGKTLLAKTAIASIQKAGGIGVFIDSEAALDVGVARTLGVDIDSLIYIQPDTMEDVFEIINSIIDDTRKSGFDKDVVMVWDSIASTPLLSEKEGKANMGERARLIGENLRTLTSKISKMNVSLIFINQLREKIGVIYGDHTTVPGGNAVPFAAAVRLRMSKKGQIDDSGKVIGEYFEAYVKKNKIAPPFKKALFRFYFKTGIPTCSGMVEYLMDKDLIRDRAPGVEKGSGWYWFTSDEKTDPNDSNKMTVSKYRYDDIEKAIETRPDLLKI